MPSNYFVKERIIDTYGKDVAVKPAGQLKKHFKKV
jgi:hypothetical protein